MRLGNRTLGPQAGKISKTSKAGKKPAAGQRVGRSATLGKGAASADGGDGWEDEPPRSSRDSSRDSRDARTPSLERSAYFGPGASSTDLASRVPRHNLGLLALDLATHAGGVPMVVPPVPFSHAQQSASVDKLILRAGELRDGRLVDVQGRSYFASAFENATEMSQGGMLLSFDEVQAQAYWAKRILVPPGQPLPKHIRSEIELGLRAGTDAGVHRILRTKDAFLLLMPHMMGDALDLARYFLFATRPLQDPSTTQQAHVVLQKHYVHEIFRTVAELHDRSIMHRDLKLQNWAFHGLKVALIDFGSAHLDKDVNASPRSTYGILAPDHIFREGPVDASKADVYATGAAAIELLTGVNFLRKDIEAYLNHGARKEDRPALEAVLADYTTAWNVMYDAANTLATQSDKLAHLHGEALTHEINKFVAVVDIFHQLNEMRPEWGRGAYLLLTKEPLGALAILNAVAPTQAGRSSAAEVALAYSAAVAPSMPTSSEALDEFATEMRTPAVRQARAKAIELAAEAKARLAVPPNASDELQLENQPRVNSLDEAKEHILKLAREKPPKIPVLVERAGGVKRIRDLSVKLQ